MYLHSQTFQMCFHSATSPGYNMWAGVA